MLQLPRPVADIAFFGHDLRESTIGKRIRSFQAYGCKVTSFTFVRRRRDDLWQCDWTNVPLGETVDRNYLRRVPKLIAAVPRLFRSRATLRGASLLYARNIDMLLLAVCARLLSGTRAPLVYEVLDIQRPFIGQGLKSRVFRAVERLCLRGVDRLVVSSPAFMDAYFQSVQNYRGPWTLLENKIVAPLLEAGSVRRRAALPSQGQPWTIGWFGTLRCSKSLRILCHIADMLGPRVRIYIRGRLSEEDLPLKMLHDATDRRDNVVFDGAYRNPDDLEEIYGKVHFSWSVDYIDEGANSDWLLPNRLYEGGYFGALAIARAGTETGRMVETAGLGWAFAEPLGSAVVEFLSHLTEAQFEDRRRKLDAVPKSLFLDETDTLTLLRATLASAYDPAGSKVGPIAL